MKKLLIITLLSITTIHHMQSVSWFPDRKRDLVWFIPLVAFHAAKEKMEEAGRSIKRGLDNVGEGLQEIGEQFAEAGKDAYETVIKNPAIAVKDFIVDNEIAADAKDVVTAYPRFFAEQAEEIADSKFAADVKEVTTKAVNKTKEAGTKVKNAAIKTGDALKNAADTVANSEAIDNLKDVGQQFAAVPLQTWAAIKSIFVD